MSQTTPSQNIVLSPERIQHIRQGLQTLNKWLPDIERMQDCGIECQEIADMAAHLQQNLTKRLHHFGGPKPS